MSLMPTASRKKYKQWCGRKIKLLSPAKINLYLNILDRYNDHFHRIQSIVERVSLFDEITLTLDKDPRIQIRCNKKSLSHNSNLCYKAAHLLQERYGIPWGFRISLKKNIPVGAGLGGGSSNAAATIVGIGSLLNLKFSSEELYAIGSSLGSDVNFFLSQYSFALIGGRGEKVLPLRGKRLCHHIIWPGIILPTKKVYAARSVKLTKFLDNVKILRFSLRRGDISLIRRNIYNTLEKSAFACCGELRSIKQFLARKGITVYVTGSGSALYTITEKIKLLRMRLPKQWLVFSAQTI